MLGFGFLGYGLSSKSADSESTSVHSFTPGPPPLQVRGIVVGSRLEASQRPAPALIRPQGHTRMRTHKGAHLSQIQKKKRIFDYMDVQEANSFQGKWCAPASSKSSSNGDIHLT